MSNHDVKIFRKLVWNKSLGPARLLDFLTDRFPYFTATEWREKLIVQIQTLDTHAENSGNLPPELFLKVNNEWVSSLDYLLENGDVIETACSREKEPDVNENFHVIYHDAEVLAVVKPANIPVSEGGRYLYNTLVQCVTRKYPLPPGQKIYTVHRIDKETSGIVIFALNAEAARSLSSEGCLFNKTYQALVIGSSAILSKASDENLSIHVTYPIAKAVDVYGKSYFSKTPTLEKIRMVATSPVPNNAPTERILLVPNEDNTTVSSKLMQSIKILPDFTPKAKSALTKVTVLHQNRAKRLSYVQCLLGTGRTHQIRVHMDALGCPVLGDKLYGQTNEQYLALTRGEAQPLFTMYDPASANPHEMVPTHLLHACALSFHHPRTNETINLRSDALELWKDHPSEAVRDFIAECM